MTAAILIPSYTAGTWDIDPVHSEVSFSVRHMMVSKVRGRFGSFSGQIVTGEDVTGSSVSATIDATSIDTNNEQRDNHIRSADFFDVANHPTWTFASNAVRVDDGDLLLDGELTIKGVTRR
jgi:polyisoprenoid-binding protein YceI